MREHSIRIRVRYGETDQMGVVYHANYLLYFEEARTDLLRTAGFAYADLEKRGLFLVVTEASCRYRAGSAYDELLDVRVWLEDVGKATLRFRYEVRGPDGRPRADGHTALAAVDARKRPTRLPAEIVARLA
ncbi:MAG TPA: thioesterase family protein [Planctomycetota bacterium]